MVDSDETTDSVARPIAQYGVMRWNFMWTLSIYISMACMHRPHKKNYQFHHNFSREKLKKNKKSKFYKIIIFPWENSLHYCCTPLLQRRIICFREKILFVDKIIHYSYAAKNKFCLQFVNCNNLLRTCHTEWRHAMTSGMTSSKCYNHRDE